MIGVEIDVKSTRGIGTRFLLTFNPAGNNSQDSEGPKGSAEVRKIVGDKI